MGRTTFVGRCVECNCALYYNESEEKLVAKGGEPGCLHHYDWPEDREKKKEEELKDIVLPLNYAKEEGEKEWRD